MMVFYGLIFSIGFWAARKRKTTDNDEVLLAGRSVPLWVGIFTMSATWIDGGYINGTAEYTASSGLMWVQAPWGYALSLVIGGLIFARPMRRNKYTTMLDPLEHKYGKKMAAVLFLPALSGEIFWTAAILVALGTTFSTVMNLDFNTAIVISAVIAIVYTSAGGLWAMAFTDVLQIIIIVIGMTMVAPFALSHAGGAHHVWEQYSQSNKTYDPSVFKDGYWWDMALLLIFGGIPWQVYFQRVLSARSERAAVGLSIGAGIVCALVAIPCILIGMAGAVYPWGLDGNHEAPSSAALTLPYVVRYMTPPIVAVFGLGAVAAAVMSSVDASILSASSMASWNVWRALFRPNISPEGLSKVVRRMVWIVGLSAMMLALNVKSVYALWVLCSDFVYCLLFPQLLCALFYKRSNFYGAAAGFAVAFVLRFGGGEPSLGIPAIIPYPWMDDAGLCHFPFRTLAMLAGLATIFIVSELMNGRAESEKT